MDIKMIDEKWYQRIAQKHGVEAALVAGYFQETKPWTRTYTEVLGSKVMVAPVGTIKIIQFSGAFFPFHDGHREIIQTAINHLDAPLMIILHVDHREYRHSKGKFDEKNFERAFDLTKTLKSKHLLETRMVFEDSMPDGCSRNFTRLYQELIIANPSLDVWFLAGGDRASFCMSFVDDGRCLVIGRDESANYIKFLIQQNERIVFIPGNNSVSSTDLRNKNGG